MQEIEIPQTLDAPPLLMIFNAHQAMTLLSFALVGAVIEQMLICTIAGYFGGTLFTKFSDRKPAGFVRHTLYYIGLPVLSQRFPNGLDREYRP